jgi:hypothetical protein
MLINHNKKLYLLITFQIIRHLEKTKTMAESIF